MTAHHAVIRSVGDNYEIENTCRENPARINGRRCSGPACATATRSPSAGRSSPSRNAGADRQWTIHRMPRTSSVSAPVAGNATSSRPSIGAGRSPAGPADGLRVGPGRCTRDGRHAAGADGWTAGRNGGGLTARGGLRRPAALRGLPAAHRAGPGPAGLPGLPCALSPGLLGIQRRLPHLRLPAVATHGAANGAWKFPRRSGPGGQELPRVRAGHPRGGRAVQVLRGVVCLRGAPGHRPIPSEQSHRAEPPAHRAPGLWLLVFGLLSCTAPFAAVIGAVWYFRDRESIRALPSLQAAICKIALGVAVAQTALLIAVAIVHGLSAG